MHRHPEAPSRRTRTVSIVNILLAIEALGLSILGLLQYLAEVPPFPMPPWLDRIIEETAVPKSPGSPAGFVFAPLAILALIGAIGFLRLWPGAWITAVTVQGLSLSVALLLHLRGRHGCVDIMMFYCIIMVAYLNYHEVKDAFRIRRRVRSPALTPRDGRERP